MGPYVFIMRRPGLAQRSTNAWGHASPPRISRRRLGMSSSNIDSSVGTQDRTVTPAAANDDGSSGPAWAMAGVAGTSVAPLAHAIQISSSEASKATENPW